MDDPQTDQEWRMVTALAAACLSLDAARQYGLITGGPAVNVDRCSDLVRQGRARGIVPTDEEVDAAVAAIAWEGTR